MTATSKANLEKRRAELNRQWSRQASIMEAATARLAEAYLKIEELKQKIKLIDYDLAYAIDHQWQEVERAHDELTDTGSRHRRWQLRKEDPPDEDSV